MAVVTIDKIMENNTYEIPSDAQNSDVKLSAKKHKTGIQIISDNSFFKRLWFFLSNPFRYLFTGKIRY